MPLHPRDHALGFAQRTKKNLLHIEQARQAGRDVHEVTQLGTSLLGLVVFPRERHLDAHVRNLNWARLRAEGWPHWEISLGDCNTLGDLIYHLRNAAAHGHMTFSSDDPDLKSVEIEVEDYKPGASAPYWRASINGFDFREFCLRFISLVEETIG
jgi:hypothetical protein